MQGADVVLDFNFPNPLGVPRECMGDQVVAGLGEGHGDGATVALQAAAADDLVHLFAADGCCSADEAR